MVEDLKNIASKIDLLWHDIKRVRDELAEHPEDIDYIDIQVLEAANNLAGAEAHILVAVKEFESLEAAQAKRQDESITAAIALLESKGFIVGTKT